MHTHNVTMSQKLNKWDKTPTKSVNSRTPLYLISYKYLCEYLKTLAATLNPSFGILTSKWNFPYKSNYMVNSGQIWFLLLWPFRGAVLFRWVCGLRQTECMVSVVLMLNYVSIIKKYKKKG